MKIKKFLFKKKTEQTYPLTHSQILRFRDLLIRERQSIIVKETLSLPAFMKQKYTREIEEINNLIQKHERNN